MTGLRIDPLRIAWAGPWNERSAIATFGLHVAGALADAGHAVDILRTELGECLEIPALATPPGRSWTVRPLAGDTAERIRAEYDIVIANMGDHFGYHGALMAFRHTLEPVVIFHDCFMADFCAGWAVQLVVPQYRAGPHPDVEWMLRAMVHATYGPAALPDDVPFWQPLGEIMRVRPMIEMFTPWAAGGVVHARHYLERVRAHCPGPVAEIPLSYPDMGVPPPPDGPRLTVATVGHINSNKQAAEVIAAIGSSLELRQRCDYKLVGAIDPAERCRLEELAQVCGVTSLVFTGWVDDATLREVLAGVDVVCCLRFPILEGGSASVITAMLSGRPVLVSDHGVYGELPDDVVLKCRPGAEASDVARHLRGLLADRATGLVLGARARAYAADRHSPARYAADLLALVRQALAAAPAIRTGRTFGHLLAAMGLDSADPAAGRVAGTLAGLLGHSI
jgi:glycosyltransferase involved in cell wall biosynthesis